MTIAESAIPGRWWHALDGERIQCDLCPRTANSTPARGMLHCGWRWQDDPHHPGDGHPDSVLTPSKKPLNHFHPVSGDPLLRYRRLQSGLPLLPELDISKSRDMDN